MSEYGVVTQASAIRFERLLPGPVERVWSYLTDSDKRAKWLASGPMETHVGGRVELRFRHADLSPQAETIPDKYKQCENGIDLTGRVTRCEPPRLLSYTWGDDSDDASEVTFELAPRGDSVLLVLTHRRLDDKALLSVAGGWHTHLDILVDHLNGNVPKPFWGAHGPRQAEYENRLASI
jgi:uncharacterized protein YndB with AHSA1/START domain